MPPIAPAKISVSSEVICPRGSGRQLVRDMSASSFCSTRQLTAAAAPATSAIPTVAAMSSSSGSAPGTARNIPMIAVNTISETTRGFVRA